ncbi:MAG: ATP-binding protein [Pseudomonadota bacterium]
MNVQDDIAALADLEPEWLRIETLAAALAETRSGRNLPETMVSALTAQQAEVSALRQEGGAWARLPIAGLDVIEMDMLSAVLAAELQPSVGYAFQVLQAGSHPYASAALLQDLLALRGREVAVLRRALSPEGALIARRIVRADPGDPYAPVRIEADALSALMGWRDPIAPPPGATRVRLSAGWDDLVLPEPCLRLLREFLMPVTHRGRVVADWGGEDTGGPLALFSGPSGTGKTFAAAVLAGTLGWPLFRVDLGQVVSKYIGETEKNLNALFDATHDRPVMLQIDEADALLGKRGEVKEARDRYANMEVSHLLSRIEQHRGPVILTTNLRTNIDGAFTRRFHAVIEFPRPDATARAALWARLLPPRAPRDVAVDPTQLGEAVALTGGAIRNAALQAAYFAAAEDRAIGLGDIALAVWRELGKTGKPLARKELGTLAEHLPDGVVGPS